MSFWQAFWRGYRRARARQQYKHGLRKALEEFERRAMLKWDAEHDDLIDALIHDLRARQLVEQPRMVSDDRPMAGRES